MAAPLGLFAGSHRCALCGAFIREGIVCPHCRQTSPDSNSGPRSPLLRTVEELALDALSVPPAYQREERPQLVRKIIREFDPDLLGLLVVVRDRAGKLWILDGQHRWLALVGLGYERALCEVLHNVPLERQAQIFSGRNSRRISPHPRDSFRADHVARDPDVVAIVSVLRRHGYQPPFGSHKGSADCFVCVSTLREVQSWGLLGPTVGLIRDAWPNDDLATQAPILAGLAACLRLYPQLPPPALRKRLSRHSADEVLRLARATHANSRERRLWVHVAGVVMDLYNHGRAAANRVELLAIPYDATRQWKVRKGRPEEEPDA
jgi:hypothetical protein